MHSTRFLIAAWLLTCCAVLSIGCGRPDSAAAFATGRHLHIIWDTSGSLPPASQQAVKDKVAEYVGDLWARTLVPGRSVTIWRFRSTPPFPIESIYTHTVALEELAVPRNKSRERLRQSIKSQIAEALSSARFEDTVSPIAEAVEFIAHSSPSAHDADSNLVIVSDLLQTSPSWSHLHLEFTENYVRDASDEKLVHDLSAVRLGSGCFRHVSLVSTYGIADSATRKALPPQLHSRVVEAFRSWLESQGCQVSLDPVMPGSATEAAPRTP